MGESQKGTMIAKFQKLIKELKKSLDTRTFFEIIKSYFQKQYFDCLLDVIQLDPFLPFYKSLFESNSSNKMIKEISENRKSILKDNICVIDRYYIYPIYLDKDSPKYLMVFNDKINKNFDQIKTLSDIIQDLYIISKVNYQVGFNESSVQSANLISQISHDINSMISLIKSNIPEIEKSVIEKMNYTEQMTKDILQYVRDIEILESKVEIKELIDSIIDTISIPDKIEIEKNYEVNSETIKIDVELISKAICEIISNSIEAFKNKAGKILINVWIEDFENKFFILRIEDNAEGIEIDFLDLVKNPFFTTRKSEYHSGLGLSVANKIIEAHGGKIRIENSNVGNTVVTLYLPIQENENE